MSAEAAFMSSKSEHEAALHAYESEKAKAINRFKQDKEKGLTGDQTFLDWALSNV